jgi:hypothetical protein
VRPSVLSTNASSNTWTCPACTLVNCIDNDSCNACAGSRSAPALSCHKEGSNSGTSDWTCLDCTYANSHAVWPASYDEIELFFLVIVAFEKLKQISNNCVEQ